MAVLNYRFIPAYPDEKRPGPGRRGLQRRRMRRWSRRGAKRADERLWRREHGERQA